MGWVVPRDSGSGAQCGLTIPIPGCSTGPQEDMLGNRPSALVVTAWLEVLPEALAAAILLPSWLPFDLVADGRATGVAEPGRAVQDRWLCVPAGACLGSSVWSGLPLLCADTLWVLSGRVGAGRPVS